MSLLDISLQHCILEYAVWRQAKPNLDNSLTLKVRILASSKLSTVSEGSNWSVKPYKVIKLRILKTKFWKQGSHRPPKPLENP